MSDGEQRMMERHDYVNGWREISAWRKTVCMYHLTVEEYGKEDE